jgi:peroxiredoxin
VLLPKSGERQGGDAFFAGTVGEVLDPAIPLGKGGRRLAVARGFGMIVSKVDFPTKSKRRKQMAIAVGQAAPEFVLKDQEEKEIRLSDYRGKNVVMVFYPLDWSPVCTNEHACFVNELKTFDKLNAQILGLSVDSVWSHKAWADKLGIRYPLLADFHPRGAVAEKFGVYLSDRGITGRAIAVIDRQGKIAWFKQYEILQLPDVGEVSSVLAKLG